MNILAARVNIIARAPLALKIGSIPEPGPPGVMGAHYE